MFRKCISRHRKNHWVTCHLPNWAPNWLKCEAPLNPPCPQHQRETLRPYWLCWWWNIISKWTTVLSTSTERIQWEARNRKLKSGCHEHEKGMFQVEKNCPDCEGRHDLDNYTQFNDLTLDEWRKTLRKKKWLLVLNTQCKAGVSKKQSVRFATT